jgi:hypothetical protein
MSSIFTVLHGTLVCMYVYKAWNSRSCPESCSSGYNGYVVTWKVLRLTTAKIKPLVFSVIGFTFSDVANICIFLILYDLCLLPAQFRYLNVYIRYLESHVHLSDRCALRKFTSGAQNHVLQALQFQKVGVCRKCPGGVSIRHYSSN